MSPPPASDESDPTDFGTARGCPKCDHTETETDTISTTGGGFSKLFDVQNRRFTVVSCANCGYSELYKGRSKNDVVDVFLG